MLELSAEVVIFLGAGSSVPFGIPASREIVNEVEANLWRHRSRINQIRLRIRNFGLTDDIEAVLSVLNFWTNPTSAIQESGSFLAEIANASLSSFKPKPRDATIAARIKEYIVRRCFVSDPDTAASIMKVYVPFFRGLRQRFSLQECNPKGRDPCPPIDIFSTNYDNVIELFCRRNGTPVCDGYEEYAGRGYVFDLEAYDKATDQVRLHKLHGTVTYARLEKDNSVDRITIFPKQGRLLIGGDVAFPDLIYPGIHACLAKEPQLELLYGLKKSLEKTKVCVAIGYSFGDSHIRQVFLDACDKNPGLKVFLVSTSPAKTMSEKRLENGHFLPIRRKFEKLDVQRDLDE